MTKAEKIKLAMEIARLLIKAGYKVKIDYQSVPNDTKNRKEYVVVFEEN